MKVRKIVSAAIASCVAILAAAPHVQAQGLPVASRVNTPAGTVNIDTRLAAEVLPYARLSDAAYTFKAVDGWTLEETRKDDESGFKAALYRHQDGRLVLAFAGTQLFDPRSRDVASDIVQFLGLLPRQYQLAQTYAGQVFARPDGRKVVLTGHSLGGGMAQFAAARLGLKAVTFNPAGLGGAATEFVGKAIGADITHVMADGYVELVDKTLVHAQRDAAQWRRSLLGKVMKVPRKIAATGLTPASAAVPDADKLRTVGKETLPLGVTPYGTVDLTPQWLLQENDRGATVPQMLAALFTLHKMTNMIEMLEAIAMAGQQAVAARTGSPGTIIAIVDSSGSMSKTDPRRLRLAALRMIVDSLGGTQRLGLIDFDDKVRVLAEAESLGPLDSTVREALRKAVAGVDANGGTSIRAGLLQARAMTGDPARTVWVLLTDGQDKQWRGEADGIVPPGVKVHTIAFSPEADREGLARLSRETAGISETAVTADDLHRIVGNLFGAAEGDEVVLVRSGTIRPGEKLAFDVVLESGQTQTEFRVSWPGSDVDLRLIDPSGRSITIGEAVQGGYGIEADTYDLIRIETPAAGVWRAELHGVQVAPAGEPYNLRVAAKHSGVRTDWQANVPVPEVGEPFAITLESSAGVRWEKAEITTWTPEGAASTRSATLGGLSAMLGVGSGETVFSVVPKKAGIYRVQIVARGRTAQGESVLRSMERSYRVAEPGRGLKKKDRVDAFIRRGAH